MINEGVTVQMWTNRKIKSKKGRKGRGRCQSGGKRTDQCKALLKPTDRYIMLYRDSSDYFVKYFSKLTIYFDNKFVNFDD